MFIGSFLRSALLVGAALLVGLVAAPYAAAEKHAHAHDGHAQAKLGELHIKGAWIREMPPTARTAAGYLTIANSGSVDDRLIAVRVDFAERTELHEMKMEGHMMTMREVEGGMVAPAGGELTLKPGGLHLMFMGLKDKLVAGQKRKVTLVFEKAGEFTFEVPVKRLVVEDDAHSGHAGHEDHGDHKTGHKSGDKKTGE